MDLLLLFLALGCYTLLLQRAGWLPSLKEVREQQALRAFQREVLQVGEEVVWHERMERRIQRAAPIHRLPSLRLK